MNVKRSWMNWFNERGWWHGSVALLICAAAIFVVAGPFASTGFTQASPGCDSYLPCDPGLDCCDGVCFDALLSCCCDGEVIAVEDCVCGGGFCTPP